MGMHAPGMAANRFATATRRSSNRPAPRNISPATPCEMGVMQAASIPAPIASVTIGPATTFANGPTTGNILNAATVSGIVAACATIPGAASRAIRPTRPGTAATIHPSHHRPNTTRPPTAHTDNRKPREYALPGAAPSMAATASESPASASVRRPAPEAPEAAIAMTSERIAATSAPASPTYAHETSAITPSRTARRAPSDSSAMPSR